MSTWFNKANIYLIAWCLYNTQGIFFPKGTLFTQILVLLLLLVSLYYCFVCNTRYKLPVYFYGLNILLSMFVVYGFFLMFGGYNSMDYSKHVDSFSYLKNILLSLLPIYAFFVFFKENQISSKNFFIWILLFISVATLNYFKNHQEMLIAAILNKSKAEEFTNNVGYEFLAIIPACVFLYKKPFLQYLAIGYCMIFMLMAMKRGAIIIGVVCIIWFMWKNLRQRNIKKKFGLMALSLLLCFVSYHFIKYRMEDSLLFQERVEKTLEGNSSGRGELYSEFANYFWNKTTPIQFIFGSGANATLRISSNYAHNDWLEIAVNQGIIGLFFFTLYWLLFIRTLSSKNFDIHTKLALQLLFVIYFMKTFFSMSYASMPIPATFILSYCLVQEKKDEQIVYCN